MAVWVKEQAMVRCCTQPPVNLLFMNLLLRPARRMSQQDPMLHAAACPFLQRAEELRREKEAKAAKFSAGKLACE